MVSGIIWLMRRSAFVAGEYFHIYNRGVEKRDIFSDRNDIFRFRQSMIEFNCIDPIGSLYENSFISAKGKRKNAKLVDVIAYCLNQNHYHFILQNLEPNGISEFMKRVGGGYTNYFNSKYKRSGVLFQGKFKSIHINSNRYLLYLSAYVNLNYKIHKKENGLWLSSWQEFISNSKEPLRNKSIILDQFKNSEEYKIFAEECLLDMIERKERFKEMEGLLFE